MKEQPLGSWGEFKREIESLQNDLRARAQKSGRLPPPLLFRGQNDSAWKLATTAERAFGKPLSLRSYYRAIAAAAKPQVETFTGQSWTVPSLDDYGAWEKEVKDAFFLRQFPGYEFLAYLRHHGFPSPLLDWTASPFVAAFFAFRERTTAERVAVFAYCEMPDGMKLGGLNEPVIHRFGPYVRSHKRHYLQQSQYTVCVEMDKDERMLYSSHENVFADADPVKGEQDLLWKFTVPATERLEALQDLVMMNVHPHSLFGTEESLLEAIFIKDLLLREKEWRD